MQAYEKKKTVKLGLWRRNICNRSARNVPPSDSNYTLLLQQMLPYIIGAHNVWNWNHYKYSLLIYCTKVMETMYEAPEIEIIGVEVEKGFAASLPDYDDEPLY